jgi:hypothetical protein
MRTPRRTFEERIADAERKAKIWRPPPPKPPRGPTERQKRRAERNLFIYMLREAGVSQGRLAKSFELPRSLIALICKRFRERGPIARRCDLVILAGPECPPIVRGEVMNELLAGKPYRVIEALVDAGPGGLSLAKLGTESGCPDARKILKRLCESDRRWKAVIRFPGVRGGGGYRIGERRRSINDC